MVRTITILKATANYWQIRPDVQYVLFGFFLTYESLVCDNCHLFDFRIKGILQYNKSYNANKTMGR
jgi:hypothetical protein